jgi:hypothetical protein
LFFYVVEVSAKAAVQRLNELGRYPAERIDRDRIALQFLA